MPRPQRHRRVQSRPAHLSFAPEGGAAQAVLLTLDEYEAVRLIDLEKQTHEQCAAQMGVSRSTVTAIYESARGKIADCLVNGKRLLIAGGSYRLCGEDGPRMACECWQESFQNHQSTIKEGESIMKIAVTYENGEIFGHFGHAEQFAIYEIEDGKVTNKTIVDTEGNGHGALATLLSDLKVDTLICGGIGGGARRALDEAGIRLYGGVSGDADAAVDALLAGTLSFDPEAVCNHHGHGEHGGHGCHSHGDHDCHGGLHMHGHHHGQGCGAEDEHGCHGHGPHMHG